MLVGDKQMVETQINKKRAEESGSIDSVNKRRREAFLPPPRSSFNSQSTELCQQLCREQ